MLCLVRKNEIYKEHNRWGEGMDGYIIKEGMIIWFEGIKVTWNKVFKDRKTKLCVIDFFNIY